MPIRLPFGASLVRRRDVEKASASLQSVLGTLPRGATTTDLTTMASLMGNKPTMWDVDDQGKPVQFGPGQPPEAAPIGGDPRAWVYRPGWNLPTLPGEGKLVSWDTLKSIPLVYEVAGKAMQIRADEIANLHIDLIARDRDTRRARLTLEKQASLIAEIKDFMAYPDGRVTWATWIRKLIRERLTTDATSVFIQRNLDPSGGPQDWGNPGQKRGKVEALLLVDGSTIKPLVDAGGRLPLPPAPAYQQFVYGVARGSYTTQDLIYAPCNVSPYSPYGFSEVEQALMHINLALKFWQSQSARYTDGTLPEGVAEAPPEWLPAQINEFNDLWDKRLAGDVRALRKMNFVPHGFTWHDFKGDDFNESLARYLFDVTCVCFDVTPMEMGMEPSHGGLGGKGLGETMTDVSERRSVRPTIRWLFDNILNPIIWNEFGATDLEWAAIELDEQSELEHAQAQDANLRNGRVSLDELIEEDGGSPIGVGRLFVFGNNVLGEPDLKVISKQGALAGGYLSTQKPADAEDEAAEAASATGAALSSSSPQAPARDTGLGGGTPSDTGPTASQQRDAELKRWETKAVRATKLGKAAAVKFESDHIPTAAQRLVRDALTECQTTDEVRAVFADLRGALSLAA